jgi:hypothetical protein
MIKIFMTWLDGHKEYTANSVKDAIATAQRIFDTGHGLPVIGVDEATAELLDDLEAEQAIEAHIRDSIVVPKIIKEHIIFNGEGMNQSNQAQAKENGNCTIISVDYNNPHEVEMFIAMREAFEQEAEHISIEEVEEVEEEKIEVKKVTVQFELLIKDDGDLPETLEGIAQEINGGIAVGQLLTHQVETITGEKEVQEACENVGSDITFFGFDSLEQ